MTGPEGVPDLAVEVTRTSAAEPLSPERERALARAAVVAALVALRQVEAASAQETAVPQRRFATAARAQRQRVRGSWRHRC